MLTDYNLDAHLQSAYKAFIGKTERPVIGLTANFSSEDATLRERYYQQIVDAGGTPLIIPPVADKTVILSTLDQIDGLLLTGGADYNPLWAGEQPSPKLGHVNAVRDLPELLITRLAFNRQIPLLGICRGIQTLAMALEGKVAQDLSELKEKNEDVSIRHSQDADRTEPTHIVNITPGSTLYNIYREPQLFVNSFHHQAVSAPGPHFLVSATAPDGVIEAMESKEYKAVLGVQWHPEWLGKEGLPLFRWLVDEASLYRQAKNLHHRTLTLDSHCDTPMFFPQGVEFGQREKHILVDLPKMKEGRQDAVTMVAYLPQPKEGKTFAEMVDTSWANTQKVITPAVFTDLIFDKIEKIVAQYPEAVSIACTPEDLFANKAEGRKSIMLGIENGLAIENNLELLDHFARRGVVYVTLCHNGDNDICDSARGSQTHGGISDFGRRAVARMNDLGIMVDLSHAAESSFYDAINISRTPIVCSHSCCRALCDHPRNLTDDQMRALAKKGGVMQITLYNGFLLKEGQATILHAIEHLEHAIRIMGIDHVGIGTDFDGDGGVPGLADSSELINFTRELLRRHYNEEDIRKIWGGNWLQVMTEVQHSTHTS